MRQHDDWVIGFEIKNGDEIKKGEIAFSAQIIKIGRGMI